MEARQDIAGLPIWVNLIEPMVYCCGYLIFAFKSF
ncbi:MAG: hypothetical protein JWQ27_2023 [Ferruginibacter sp.]|nr:hypothetical protein [Ferruginibacter sp.]